MIEARRPDIVVIDKVKKETMIIDVVLPGVCDKKVCDKEKKDQKIQLVQRQNCQIMAKEKGRCDSHCSRSIRSYNNKV